MIAPPADVELNVSAFTLGNIADKTRLLRLVCPRCGRHGQYRVDRLIAEFGPDLKLPDLLNRIAKCPKNLALGNDGCGVHYAETPWQPRRE